MENIAQKYGLNSRVKLESIAENHVAIVKRIKSRIIQKDALKLIEIADVIRSQDTLVRVSLICNDNICSKSVKLLNDHNIEIQF